MIKTFFQLTCVRFLWPFIFVSQLSFAENNQSLFLKWLEVEDPQFAKELDAGVVLWGNSW